MRSTSPDVADRHLVAAPAELRAAKEPGGVGMGEDRRRVAPHLARIGAEFARGGDREHVEGRHDGGAGGPLERPVHGAAQHGGTGLFGDDGRRRGRPTGSSDAGRTPRRQAAQHGRRQRRWHSADGHRPRLRQWQLVGHRLLEPLPPGRAAARGVGLGRAERQPTRAPASSRHRARSAIRAVAPPPPSRTAPAATAGICDSL